MLKRAFRFFIQQTEGGYWGYTINFLRPELVIDRSSPVKQNIGDFVDEEEKILALFKVLKHIDHHCYLIAFKIVALFKVLKHIHHGYFIS